MKQNNKMPNVETYGMIMYGGVTTVLFLIVSVLAYKRLNDENTNIPMPIAKKDTLFPFNTITPNVTITELQQHDESVTEASFLFNTNYWSKHQMDENDNEIIVILNNDDDDGDLNLNITPQMINPKLRNDKSSDLYYAALSNTDCINQFHLQRQRSRHSLSHLNATKRTCVRISIEYCKEMMRNRSIYSPSLQHTWDVATDISVLLKWGKHAFTGSDMPHINFVALFWTSLFVQIGYRLVSGYAVYKSERSIKKAMLQICDLLMLREIYVSHIECRITDTLVYIKKLEAVLEAAPQLILTTYFFLRVGTLEHSYTEIIGWLWSFFTLSTKVINDDTKMYKHIKSRWNKQFMYRCLFRLFEICSRVLMIGLVATAVSARAAAVIIVIDLVFLLFSYYYGLLSNDKMNILGSLITFVDLTIHPKVSPLYSWYISNVTPKKRVTNYTKISMDKRISALKVNINMNEIPFDDKLRELSSIEAMYLERQQQERLSNKSGCRCRCRAPFVVHKCVDKCFFIALFMSWVWCIYICCAHRTQYNKHNNHPHVALTINTSISEETIESTKELKIKKVRFAPELTIDNITAKSNTITDSKSVMKIVDFVQQKSCDIPDEEYSHEEPPQDWWNSRQGSTKFSVATLRSPIGIGGLTPFNEYKADAVDPMKESTIKETSDSESVGFPDTIAVNLDEILGNLPRDTVIQHRDDESLISMDSQSIDLSDTLSKDSIHLHDILGNLPPDTVIQHKEDESSISMDTESIDLSDTLSKEENGATPLAKLLSNIHKIEAPSYHPVRNMAIQKSFEFESDGLSGNSTPFVPDDVHAQALLALAGSNDTDRLMKLFTNRSALNTPNIRSECSTAATSPVDVAMGSGFPDIDDPLPLSRGTSLFNKSMTIIERPKLEELETKNDAQTLISPSLSALTLEKSLSTELDIEIVEDSKEDSSLDSSIVPVDVSASYIDLSIVHRYAFLVVLARSVQSWFFVPFITYIVYINPQIFGGKTDIELSTEYWIDCYPWCTSQSLRNELKNSLVFMQFLMVCLLTATLSIMFFLLSSPYLLFATSITRSPLALLKTGCIYDSIQYFSKKTKWSPPQILSDFNFMQLFFDVIIKRRIPVFYCEGKDSDDDRLHHKILKNADSEILLTALQLNARTQLSETIAIRSIKEGYLHLLQFIMLCASMDNENRLIFDPSNCVDEYGNGLLHVAIICGDEHIIQYVLDVLGYDQRKNMSNQDVIDLLILHGDIHILRLLLSFFERADRLDLTKKTFFRSIKRGNLEFVRVLMQVLNKKYNTTLWVTSYIDRDKNTLTGRTLLMCTAINGHGNTTKWLLNTMKVDTRKQDREGKTALMHAVINQNVNVVDILIKHQHINCYINTVCDKGITALLYGTIENDLDCVCTLMRKRRLDPNICGGEHQETALIHASRYGHEEIALQLIKAKKIDVNITDREGKTALMWSARYGLTKNVKALLRHEDVDVEMKDNENKSALHHVKENIYLGENYEIIKKAIEAHIKSKSQAKNVDPERLKQKRRSFIMIGELAALHTSNKIKRRYSSVFKKVIKSRSVLDVPLVNAPLVDLAIDDIEFYLWYSIQMDYDYVCHWLLRHTRCGRDLVGRKDLEMIDISLVGKNAFHFAVKTGSDKCLRILLEMDAADKTETFVNEKDNEGFTPLIYAVIDGKLSIIELLLNYDDTEMNASDDDHKTPLMHAAMRGYANIVQLLMNHKNINSPNYVDKKGQTALCLAVRYNRPRVVQLLCNHKDIDVDKARNNGRTPLMYAVKNGLLNIVNMLLFTNNVDINKKDYIEGKTVEFYIDECRDDNIRKEMASKLIFYKMTKNRKMKKRNFADVLMLNVLDDIGDIDVDIDDIEDINTKPTSSDCDFYSLASKVLWNTHSVNHDMDIQDKLFNKWLMQLEILHICDERHDDDNVFRVLWHHWVGDDVLSDIKWYYFLVMISNKGWHRLFIRFIDAIQGRDIKIDWRFIPNDPREIDLMAKHGHVDELELYLQRIKKANDSNLYIKNEKEKKERSCLYFGKYIEQKHMKLILESVFENFGQTATNKPKLAQSLRFVLAKTLSQYLFNSKCC